LCSNCTAAPEGKKRSLSQSVWLLASFSQSASSSSIPKSKLPNSKQSNKLSLQSPLFHIQSSAISLFFFLTILQNLNLHWLVLLEANQSIWVEKNYICKLQPTVEWSAICNFEVFFVVRSCSYVVLQFFCIFLHINTTQIIYICRLWWM
jgi:hypothetical protein